ncbi:MAG: tetratricopeptide repeat protein [Sedimentisphaerales bacterium]|nr:tetratricopeptide repeat protein [Sedimentisphaerales bacterium]
MLHKTIIMAVIIACLGSAGCESHSESKKLAQKRWEKASFGVKLNLAQQEYENGRFGEAKRIISECVTTDPNNAHAHLLYGKLLSAEDRWTDAERELRLAIELDEKLAEGWYRLGQTIQKQERTQQKIQDAMSCHNNALTLSPANIDYITAVAESYAEQEQPDEAIRLLEEKITAVPRQVLLKTSAADLMWRLGKNERAIELYKQAMMMKSDDENIAESLGYCYVFSGRWNEGAEIFNKLVEQCQDEQKKKPYLQAAALCNVNSAQYNLAVDCYNELSVEGRDDAEIWMRMGQAALGAGAAERAFMCGERALAIQPGNANALALTGCAQYSMGYYTAAIKSFEKISSDEKNGAISWLMRARCYEQLGHKDKAGQAYKKALEIKPDSKLGNFLAKGKDAEYWKFAAKD